MSNINNNDNAASVHGGNFAVQGGNIAVGGLGNIAVGDPTPQIPAPQIPAVPPTAEQIFRDFLLVQAHFPATIVNALIQQGIDSTNSLRALLTRISLIFVR